MSRVTADQFGFPPLRGAVRNLVVISTAIYVLQLLITAFAPPAYIGAVYQYAFLVPESVLTGWVWQLLTYGFLYASPLNFLFAMLGLYFLGTAVEQRIGSRAFVRMFLASLIAAGVVGVLLSLTKVVAQGPAFGSGPATNAILMIFFFLYRDAPIIVFPLPVPIPVKYLVLFTAAVEGAYLLLTHFSLFFTVQLLGMGAGYVWYRFAWRRTSSPIRNPFADLRNGYYRWKRRRASRKFQVYMRDQGRDPKGYFDEQGNFLPLDREEKKDGKKDRGGWVN
jgi:membrane associated rhomboid family serine protease